VSGPKHPADRLNLRFYEEYADAFAGKRTRPWPGWERLPSPPPGPDGRVCVLDVGCGHGRFARHWLQRGGPPLDYTGVDFSGPLLTRARETVPARPQDRLRWIAACVPDEPLPSGPFQMTVAFGLLHHIAGRERRAALIRSLADETSVDGHLCVTVWQFGQDARLAGRGVSARETIEAVEPAARILDFDGRGERLCVPIDLEEVDAWGPTIGLQERARFFADGRTNTLNLYVVYAGSPRSR